jgi:hypothetical protein
MLNAYRRSLSGSFERLHADFGVPQDVVDAFPKQNGMTRMVENVHATIYLGLRKARRSLVRLMRI